MKLKKELGFLDVFCISSGAMISSGIFILPALAYAKTGSSVLIAYLLAGILIIPTVLSKAELTTAMPKTGGIFFFADRSMGPLAGTLGGLAAWFSLAFKSAFALLGMGIFMMILSPGIPMWQVKAIAVGLCLFFAAINLVGVKLAGKLQIFLVIGLLVLLVAYVIYGAFFIKTSNFSPFATHGYSSIITTTGFVFVSYAGTTKTAAVAGEVKNPGRNLPLGMFLSWGVVTFLYLAVIAVTIGVLDPQKLANSVTPISDGGEAILGTVGLILMTVAGLLAFISTGNAGILSASRDPMAMGKDDLLPSFFGKLSPQGTPWVAILITTGFMICVILFLDLETFVKTASTLKLTLFIIANLSLIFMRESHMRNYRPKYKAPFYPWIQIVGIVAYAYLISEMGTMTHITVAIFFLLGLGWYWFFARGKIKRQYALLEVVKKMVDIDTEDHLLDEELREICIERDNISERRFIKKIQSCPVIDRRFFVAPAEFANDVSTHMCKSLKCSRAQLYDKLLKRDKESNMMVHNGLAIISFKIKGKEKFEMALVRSEKGAYFKEDSPPVHAAIVVVHTPDQEGFYVHALMWLIQISEVERFQEKWRKAKSKKNLRKLVLDAYDAVLELNCSNSSK